MNNKYVPDWRLFCNLPGIYSKNPLVKGQEVFVKAIVPTFRMEDKKVSYGLPNACALYLGNAYKLYKQSDQLKKYIIKNIVNNRIPEKLAYSFFEKIIGSLFFGFSSVESFANIEIPDNRYHYKKMKNIIIAEGKKTIERFEPIDIKLCRIIPEVWKVESPKSKKVWYDFKLYKNIRDRLVHLKEVDQTAKNETDDNIWNLLFIQHSFLTPDVPKNLIGYYYNCKKENAHDWFKNFPY